VDNTAIAVVATGADKVIYSPPTSDGVIKPAYGRQ